MVMGKVESFAREGLLRCGYGEMFGPGNAQLPVPNMLMMDRFTRIADEGGAYGKGLVIERDRLIGTTGFWQFTSGIQAGARNFSMVILFRDKAALDLYTAGKAQFLGQAGIAFHAGHNCFGLYVQGRVQQLFTRHSCFSFSLTQANACWKISRLAWALLVVCFHSVIPAARCPTRCPARRPA